MTLYTPTSDLEISWVPTSVQTRGGQLLVDLVLTQANDLSLVSDEQKIIQEVTRYILNALGANPFDPSYGNVLFNIVGHVNDDPEVVADSVASAAQDYFLHQQALESAQGFLSSQEQIVSITSGGVYLNSPGNITMIFNIESRAGTISQTDVTFSA